MGLELFDPFGIDFPEEGPGARERGFSTGLGLDLSWDLSLEWGDSVGVDIAEDGESRCEGEGIFDLGMGRLRGGFDVTGSLVTRLSFCVL